jgi:hypothetical protein
MHSASPELMAQGYRTAWAKGSMYASFQRAPAQTLPETTAWAQRPLRPHCEPGDARDGGSERHHGTRREKLRRQGVTDSRYWRRPETDCARRRRFTANRLAHELGTTMRRQQEARWMLPQAPREEPPYQGGVRHNVGVDRHAAALRRETYAPAHSSRRNAAACPCRTTC